MRSVAIVLQVLLLVGACPAIGVAQPVPPAPNPKVEIAYITPRSEALKPIHDRLKDRRLLERLAVFLSPMNLPRTLKIQTDECGELTRVYTRERGATICYEYIASINAAAEKAVKDIANVDEKEQLRRLVVTGATMQSSVYRLALALLEIYEVPIWGRFADAADRLTAFIMLQFGPEVATVTLAGSSVYFRALDRPLVAETDYAMTHSPALQRMFNYMCIAHGFDLYIHGTDYEWKKKKESYFGDFAPGNRLPQNRARRCVNEYAQAAKAFFTAFWPHIDEQKVEQLRATAILRAGDL